MKPWASTLCVLALAVTTATAAAIQVWPTPKQVELHGDGKLALLTLGENQMFSVEMSSRGLATSVYLQAAVKRYQEIMRKKLGGADSDGFDGGSDVSKRDMGTPIARLQLFLNNDDALDEKLSRHTSYRYIVSVADGRAQAHAETIYGLMYALETLVQLAVPVQSKGQLSLALPHHDFTISDAPDYQWRGLMLDAGRRFFPPPLVENLMDTMAANKLNVLHLHASDHCRFGVESKLYPNLTQSLTGDYGGFYTQEDVKSLIEYGKARGIRIVPEFDIPGHSRGFRPLKSNGVEFCTDDESQSQLYGSDSTYKVIHDLLKEMSELFEDDVFNIGADETSAQGRCTVNDTFAFERKVLNAIESEFGKTGEGWEEILFDEGAATMKTIVNAWTSHTASTVIAQGRKAVESRSRAFYFTNAAPGGPAGWSNCWYDIGYGVNASSRHLLLGGEMSMWSDTYCIESQCGAFRGDRPVGSKLFPPTMDEYFAKSIGGMIWPRGYVGAGAFWNYNASVDVSSADFTNHMWQWNNQLQQRGAFVCPSNCSCDQLTACGKPYVPSAGESAIMI